MKVLGDKVLVEPTKAPNTTKGGLILPEGTKEPPETGKVVAVGPGKFAGSVRVVPEVKVGDKVIFGRYSGSDVELDGKKYKILTENEILAVIP